MPIPKFVYSRGEAGRSIRQPLGREVLLRMMTDQSKLRIDVSAISSITAVDSTTVYETLKLNTHACPQAIRITELYDPTS